MGVFISARWYQVVTGEFAHIRGAGLPKHAVAVKAMVRAIIAIGFIYYPFVSYAASHSSSHSLTGKLGGYRDA